MTLFQAIILSFVQGISEFLPISSKGHLNLAQHFLGLTPSLAFDIFLNTATLISVLIYFRNKISYFFKNLPYIIVGSIPAVILGFVFKHKVEAISANIKLLPYFMLVTAAYLFISNFLKSTAKKINYKNAFLIGVFQSFALLPGISRSGSTIFGGLLSGLSAEEAFNFSFCLFIPASFGALLLDIKDIKNLSGFGLNYIIAFILTSIVGYISLVILKKVLVGNKFWIFGIYMLLLSLTLFFIL